MPSLVQAEDGDLDLHGEVMYSVPEESPFSIGSETGEIRTKAALDYEKQQVWHLYYESDTIYHQSNSEKVPFGINK